jgi:hypothetical protein
MEWPSSRSLERLLAARGYLVEKLMRQEVRDRLSYPVVVSQEIFDRCHLRHPEAAVITRNGHVHLELQTITI